jgi:hypothetical protein
MLDFFKELSASSVNLFGLHLPSATLCAKESGEYSVFADNIDVVDNTGMDVGWAPRLLYNWT